MSISDRGREDSLDDLLLERFQELQRRTRALPAASKERYQSMIEHAVRSVLTERDGTTSMASMDTKATRLNPSRDRFIERFALSLEREGMPRIAGRVFAFLLLQGSAFTFEELAGHLRVSRASVSTNTRNLESIGLIERISVPGERKTRYQLVAEPFTPMLASAQERLNERQQILGEFLGQVDAETPDDGALARLDALGDFQALAIEWVDKLTETWKASTPSDPA